MWQETEAGGEGCIERRISVLFFNPFCDEFGAPVCDTTYDTRQVTPWRTLSSPPGPSFAVTKQREFKHGVGCRRGFAVDAADADHECRTGA